MEQMRALAPSLPYIVQAIGRDSLSIPKDDICFLVRDNCSFSLQNPNKGKHLFWLDVIDDANTYLVVLGTPVPNTNSYTGGANQRERSNEECDGSEDSLPPWCGERREASGRHAGENCLIEFGVVGSTTETFWPKPGDILILANERKGCRWPAFDGHLEIYVDDDYFSKSSVALLWNYSFKSGDIVLRFGDFDRHWRWRANDHIHVFLRDNEVFYLVAR